MFVRGTMAVLYTFWYAFVASAFGSSWAFTTGDISRTTRSTLRPNVRDKNHFLQIQNSGAMKSKPGTIEDEGRRAVEEFANFRASQENEDFPEEKNSTPSQQTREQRKPSVSVNEAMQLMGTNPRRILLSMAASSAIAFGTNFLGGTSKLLQALPEDVVEKSGLDIYYPRGEFKRYRGVEYGYSFLLPKEWVADGALLVAQTQARSGVLDYSIAQSKRTSRVLPDAAFGPVGRFTGRGVSQADENVSVVASKLPVADFTLRGTLGSPENAAETLFRTALAPEGSGKIATLVAACEENRGLSNVYQFDYTVDRGAKRVPLRAISVISERNNDTLITLTVVSPASEWEKPEKEAKLRKIAESFKLTR